MNYLSCPKCRNSKSWQDGGTTSIEDTDTAKIGITTYYCMKCGYFEQERHYYKPCEACRGEGHTEATREVVASGTMKRDELRRRLTEDFMIIQGRDPADIYMIPKDEWVDPEDIRWVEDDDGEDERP